MEKTIGVPLAWHSVGNINGSLIGSLNGGVYPVQVNPVKGLPLGYTPIDGMFKKCGTMIKIEGVKRWQKISRRIQFYRVESG
jgi:hypothetical protein